MRIWAHPKPDHPWHRIVLGSARLHREILNDPQLTGRLEYMDFDGLFDIIEVTPAAGQDGVAPIEVNYDPRRVQPAEIIGRMQELGYGDVLIVAESEEILYWSLRIWLTKRVEAVLAATGPWPPLLVWMLLIYLFSDRPDIPQVGTSLLDFIVKKSLHALAYGILAGLWWRALVSLALRRPRLWAFLASLAYAASDEWHQRFVPGRHGQPRDVLIDGLGAAVAMLWIARRGSRWRDAAREPRPGS